MSFLVCTTHSTHASANPKKSKRWVSRYYESGAVFESPLLSAHGRDQIANQFIWHLPCRYGCTSRSCVTLFAPISRFDGTRAGIIDHTVTVTLLPALFGSSASKPTPDADASDVNRTPRASYPLSASASAYPMTPHLSLTTPYSAFSRFASRPHSPTTLSASRVSGVALAHTTLVTVLADRAASVLFREQVLTPRTHHQRQWRRL